MKKIRAKKLRPWKKVVPKSLFCSFLKTVLKPVAMANLPHICISMIPRHGKEVSRDIFMRFWWTSLTPKTRKSRNWRNFGGQNVVGIGLYNKCVLWWGSRFERLLAALKSKRHKTCTELLHFWRNRTLGVWNDFSNLLILVASNLLNYERFSNPWLVLQLFRSWYTTTRDEIVKTIRKSNCQEDVVSWHKRFWVSLVNK